jgi:hypothetical protein
MKDGAQEPLELKLAQLPRELAPPDNLWPAIVREIARPPHRLRPLAFASAAAAASACLATALTWAVLHGRGAHTAIAPVAATRTVSFDEPRDAGYLAARTALQQTFRERLALLDPDTRAQIEASLALIHRAHEEIRKALEAAPDNPVLEHLLQSTWHDEFDLYDDVVRTTQPTLARS